MEGFLVGKENLKLPPAAGQDTIFEYLVNEQGEWEHWSERVSSLDWTPYAKSVKGHATRLAHLENLSLNFSIASFVIRVNLLHP